MKASTYIGFVAAASLCGCATEQDYIYTPELQNVVTQQGLPASRIEIPQEQPQGTVEVTSFGIAQLQSGSASLRALQVRMIVTNDGDDTPWRVDTREQLTQIAGEGTSRAMYVNADTKTMPIVTIARHQRRVIDLYFPLPYTITSAAQLPRFDMLWQVKTSARVVASRSTFDRVSEPDVAYGYNAYDYSYWPYWADYGPYWWYDPFFPSAVFFHTRPFFPHSGHIRVSHFDGHFQAGRSLHAGLGPMHGGGMRGGGGMHSSGGGMHGGGGGHR